jgi:zinc protease
MTRTLSFKKSCSRQYRRASALLILPLVTLSLISFRSDALEISLNVEKFTLENGLTVLLHEDHSIPMISYHTWYHVGSRDEQPGVTGAAHMLEHMMFKGAKKYSDKQFDQILHANGITNNAFTTNDYTGFYENLPSDKLELIMDVEVDRMRDLTLSAEALKSELQVVGEERRWRVDNNPVSLLRESMMEALFQVHPYHWPVIGYMKDIQAYTPEKLRKFYDTFYVPNNAVLVIAGDFKTETVKALVTKYYGVLAARPLPEVRYTQEPESIKAQRFEKNAEVQNTSVIISYKTVPAGHPDQYPLDLLANILGAGSSSRLNKNLVYKKQEATDAGAFSETSADPGFFSLHAIVVPGHSSKISEQALDMEVQKLRDQPISEKELRKAKNQIMKDYIEGLMTIDGKAQTLAVTEILRGDYHALFDDLNKYEKVTSKDLKRVAQTYFKAQRKVTAVLNPKK